MLRYFLWVTGMMVALVGPIDFDSSTEKSKDKGNPSLFPTITTDPGGPAPKCPPSGCEKEI